MATLPAAFNVTDGAIVTVEDCVPEMTPTVPPSRNSFAVKLLLTP